MTQAEEAELVRSAFADLRDRLRDPNVNDALHITDAREYNSVRFQLCLSVLILRESLAAMCEERAAA